MEGNEAMAYRSDKDLEFLSRMTSEELNDLVYCLTHDKDGDVRYTEELTQSSRYKNHYPDHRQYWELIAAEIQCFGANTFVTMLRGGKGVTYKEVLMNVCDKLKVKYNKSSNTETIENNLLMKIIEDALEKMSPEELRKLAVQVGLEANKANIINSKKIFNIFRSVFLAGGFKSYQYTVIIANMALKAIVGRGLSLAGNAALTKTMSLLVGPIGLVFTSLWTVADITGAAYRVTIPAVIHVAVLRQKYLNGKIKEKNIASENIKNFFNWVFNKF